LTLGYFPDYGRGMDQLIADIDDFLTRNSMSEKAFGLAAMNDHHFVRDLREKGRSPSLRTVDRVNKFMAEYLPQSAAA